MKYLAYIPGGVGELWCVPSVGAQRSGVAEPQLGKRRRLQPAFSRFPLSDAGFQPAVRDGAARQRATPGLASPAHAPPVGGERDGLGVGTLGDAAPGVALPRVRRTGQQGSSSGRGC